MIMEAAISMFGRVPLVSKAVAMATGTVGLFSFFVGELLTQNTVIAAALSALSIPAAAYFAARPKIIAAQAAREAAERSGDIADFKTIIEKMAEVHEQAVAVKERQLEEKEIENKLLRISKHNALKALQHAHFHISRVESGENPPRFQPILMDEISGQEDRQTQQLVHAAATRIAVNAAANGNGGES